MMKLVVSFHNFMSVPSLRNSDQWMVGGQQRCFVYCAHRLNVCTVHSVKCEKCEVTLGVTCFRDQYTTIVLWNILWQKRMWWHISECVLQLWV